MRVATASSLLLPLLLATCHWMASSANPDDGSEHQPIASVNDDVTIDDPPPPQLVPPAKLTPPPPPSPSPKSNGLSKFFPDEGPGWQFLHIPKTGGSSIDALLRARGHQHVKEFMMSSVPRVIIPKNCTNMMGNHGSIGHFTPEQLSRCGVHPHPYEGKQVYCVIREPVERFFSEWRWRLAARSRSKLRRALPKDADGKFSVTAFAQKTASAFRNLPRDKLRLDESGLHLQPQSWYIYDSNWGTTCHKTLLFDEVMPEMKIHVNKGADISNVDRMDAGSDNEELLTRPLRIELRNILRDVYKEDFEMYDEVLSSAMRKMRFKQENA